MANNSYLEFRVPLSYTKDRELIEHIESYFPADMSRAEIARQVIRCHKKVIETVGSPDNLDGYLPIQQQLQQIYRKVESLKVVATDDSDVEPEKEIQNGFDFGGDSFFEEDE